MERIIETRKQCAELINEKIKDPTLTEFLFGTETASFKHVTSIAIKRLVYSAFSVVYAKWLSLSRREASMHATASARTRSVFDVLARIYRYQPLTLSAVIYTLSEGQKDLRELGDASFFNDIFEKDSYCYYNRVYDAITEWDKNANSSTGVDDQVLWMARLVFNYKWLENTGWDEGSLSFIHCDKALKCDSFLFVDEFRTEYILIDDQSFSGFVARTYMSLESFKITNISHKGDLK